MSSYKRKAGLPPGTIVSVGPNANEKTVINYIGYNETEFEEKTDLSLEECLELKTKETVSWIDVTGLGNVDILEKIGEAFHLHPLILEDIANTGQRPKMEDLDSAIFMVLKMLSYDEEDENILIEQVSIVFMENVVVSFQEVEGDVFGALRKRIRSGKGWIRKMGADYLAYALCDAVVDNYFNILEKFGDRIESIEETVVTDPSPETLKTIHAMKQDTVVLRKSIWPLREVIGGVGRSESHLVKKATRQYFRDVYDHTIQVIDTVESFRDLVSGMLDIYLSSVSNRMNDVMKVLTIIATIFIPLTFIAGIYGMNFEYMPELEWTGGYFAVLGLMFAIFLGMLVYFKWKKWL